MFLFTIAAKPKPDNIEHKKSGGAYVDAYIDFKEEEAVVVLARYYIEDAVWFTEHTDEVSWLSKKDAKKEKKQYEYFLQAKECGSCLLFNIWPIDAEDAETKH